MNGPVIKARLLPRAESAVRGGHPWVFAESVKSLSHEGGDGDTVAIYDRRDRLLALGWYDPSSPIRIRVLHVGGGASLDRDWWVGRAQRAAARRGGLFPGQSEGVRMVHGESDGFPGLVADRYADTLVVKLYSAIWLPRWQEMEGVFREVFGARFLVLRLSRNIIRQADRAGLREGFRGAEGARVVVFHEHGVRFEADVLHGQKTGFFLDQRDNRLQVREMARGTEVLNLFSYSGGFSLQAARGGARRVVDVDISDHALAGARRNFALNPDLAGVVHEGIQADVFKWVKTPGPSFDLVICDPPSLAKRERERAGAVAAYRRLNQAAMARVRPGGTLLAASCSAHVSDGEFFGAIRQAARASGRRFQELWTSHHATDHPADFPEARYLKAVCIGFDGPATGFQ